MSVSGKDKDVGRFSLQNKEKEGFFFPSRTPPLTVKSRFKAQNQEYTAGISPL